MKTPARRQSPRQPEKQVRYAVVGLGHIAQAAVLPGFAQAKNSRLAALISGDADKLRKLAKKYRVPLTYDYAGYDDCLRSGEIDAVYIALPNDQHRDYCERAAAAGVHILCEKPLALTVREGEAILRAIEKNHVKFMTAYRLHFEPATLATLELVRARKIGELRYFNSTFSFQIVDEDNIRLQRERGGGAIYDIGTYCINAARTLFAAEPTEVFAMSVKSRDRRFREVDETTSVILRFPEDRVASFTISFGASTSGRFEIVGTKGSVVLDPAYEYAEALEQTVTIDDKPRKKKFPHTDQFGGEIEAFSECILENKEPEPSVAEGVADLRVIEAIFLSARTGRLVKLPPFRKSVRPRSKQRKQKPAIEEPQLVKAKSAHG